MFIHTRVFDRQWAEVGCDDDDLLELQKAICDNPQGAPVIPGTGGIRKIRITLEGRGKSGGARVLYVDFVIRGVVGLLYAYPKNKKENITDEGSTPGMVLFVFLGVLTPCNDFKRVRFTDNEIEIGISDF
jgi:hypothetical protein